MKNKIIITLGALFLFAIGFMFFKSSKEDSNRYSNDSEQELINEGDFYQGQEYEDTSTDEIQSQDADSQDQLPNENPYDDSSIEVDGSDFENSTEEGVIEEGVTEETTDNLDDSDKSNSEGNL